MNATCRVPSGTWHDRWVAQLAVEPVARVVGQAVAVADLEVPPAARCGRRRSDSARVIGARGAPQKARRAASVTVACSAGAAPSTGRRRRSRRTGRPGAPAASAGCCGCRPARGGRRRAARTGSRSCCWAAPSGPARSRSSRRRWTRCGRRGRPTGCGTGRAACRRPRLRTFMWTHPVVPGTARSVQVAPPSSEIITALTSWSPTHSSPGARRSGRSAAASGPTAEPRGAGGRTRHPRVAGNRVRCRTPGRAVVVGRAAADVGGVLVARVLSGVQQPERAVRGGEEHGVLLRAGGVVGQPHGFGPQVAAGQAGEPERDVRPRPPGCRRTTRSPGRRPAARPGSRRGSARRARAGRPRETGVVGPQDAAGRRGVASAEVGHGVTARRRRPQVVGGRLFEVHEVGGDGREGEALGEPACRVAPAGVWMPAATPAAAAASRTRSQRRLEHLGDGGVAGECRRPPRGRGPTGRRRCPSRPGDGADLLDVRQTLRRLDHGQAGHGGVGLGGLGPDPQPRPHRAVGPAAQRRVRRGRDGRGGVVGGVDQRDDDAGRAGVEGLADAEWVVGADPDQPDRRRARRRWR